MQITETQIAQVNNQIQALLKAESFYGKKLEEPVLPVYSQRKIFKSFRFLRKMI